MLNSIHQKFPLLLLLILLSSVTSLAAVPTITVTINGTGEFSGDITFDYLITDSDNLPVDLLVEFDIGNGYTAATITGTVSNIPPAGYSGSLIWNSLTDANGVDASSAIFRITPSDSNGSGSAGESAAFHLDNNEPPFASIETPAGEVVGDIAILYQLSDTENDELTLIGEYAVGGIWNAAVTQTGITSDNYSGIMLWNSLTDLQGIDNESILFRITVADTDSGNTVATSSFHVDNNNPPFISATGPTEDGFRGNALINYTLFDDETDVLGLLIEYSINNGSSWNSASITGDSSNIINYSSSVTWHSLSDIPLFDGVAQIRLTPHDNDRGSSAIVPLSIDNIGLPEVSFTSAFPVDPKEVVGDHSFDYQIIDNEGDSVFLDIEFRRNGAPSWTPTLIVGETNTLFPDKYTGTLIWQSDSAGQLSHEDRIGVEFRIRARDKHNGVWADTLIIHVDNNLKPEVLTVPMDIPETITGSIDLPLELTDIEGDTLRILIYFSSDSGSTWKRGHALGESNSLLPSTFTPTIRYTPTTIWDSVLDIGFVLDAVTRLRFAAVDNDRSEWVESNEFIVNNIVGDFSGDFKIDFDDIAGFVDTWISQDLVRETGPVDSNSTVPDLIVTKDGVIDFEDLMAFILMWNWSYDNNKVSLSKQISNFSSSKSEHPITVFNKTDENQTAELYFSLPELKDVWSGRVLLSYDQSEIKIRDISLSTEYNKNRNSLFIKRTENSEGVAEIVVAPLDIKPLSHWQDDIFRINFTSDKHGYTGMISIAYDLRDKNGAVLSSGIFEHRLEIISTLPKEYALHNNYPNPFNPVTTIEFDLPVSGRVDLKIFNLLGEEVTTLLKEEFEAGRHSVIWDGLNNAQNTVSSGVYFYSIKSGSFSAVKKMILIR
ncbi:T9SS type A sorting domain-containing protein [Candidatus Marinimicrobia bacterium MT.SAG.3]|nr:T9SS type A sorting domain-containing protein [Candidatus Marinimicrobia bacterium MT.SAG.3]